MRIPRSAHVLAVLAVSLAACASSLSSHVDDDLARIDGPSIITVDNQRTEDATVYVQHAGVPTRRLGRVGSLTRATFILIAGDGAPGSEFQFVAKMFANGFTDVSDPIPVERSAHYTWQLAPARGQQFLTYRPYAAADGTSTPLTAVPYNGDRLPGNPSRRGTQ